ncbi:hypothetical protein CA695_08830 [Escherichia coli]|nr:hypothetical protein [Escherichia coli H30]EFB9824790.1 hypothetical protein [Escherichia coli]OYI07167.1 hypothetical protein CI726_08485 [Shigella sonnei]EFO0681596.1 hypothetical protein [Escherichia coli]MBK3152435.1 hypothetical protein [Escherichia coli]
MPPYNDFLGSTMSNKNYESHRKAIVSKGIPPALFNRLTNSDVQVINTFLTRVSKLELSQQEKDWIIKIISMV